jgi:hypothetical protein
MLLELMGEELELGTRSIDYGHDRTLIQQNLKFTPEERIRRQAEWSNGMRAFRNAARRTAV